MEDIRNNWFWQQHYLPEELEQLWKWVQDGGINVYVKEVNSLWSGFHHMDTDMTIDISCQATKEDCCNWMRRLGFNVIE